MCYGEIDTKKILKHAYLSHVTDFRDNFSSIILRLRKLKWQVEVLISMLCVYLYVCVCVSLSMCIPEVLQIIVYLDFLKLTFIFFPTNFS